MPQELPSAQELPPFMHAIPKWSPSAWFQPSLSLTFASIGVLIALVLSVRFNALGRALFRFPTFNLESPWNQYYKAIPIVSLGIVLLLLWRTWNRPSPRFVHYWLAGLFLTCLGIGIWGVADKEYRGAPVVHLAIAITLFSSITLLPRLIRVFPDSKWVDRAGLVSFLVMLCLGFAVTTMISRVMIASEVDRVDREAGLLEQAASQLRDAAQNGQALEGISLANILPDKYHWEGAKILSDHGDKNRTKLLVDACQDVTEALKADLNPPTLNMPRYNLTQDRDRHWEPNLAFNTQSTVELNRIRQTRRLIEQMRPLTGTADAAGLFNTLDEERRAKVDEWNRQANSAWAAQALSANAPQATLGDLLETPLGNLPEFKDIGRGRVTRSQADGWVHNRYCAASEYWTRTEQDGVDSDNNPIMKVIPYQRIECYAYADGAGNLSIGAEAALVYRGSGQKNPPFSIDLYFEPPTPEAKAGFLDSVKRQLREAGLSDRADWDHDMVRLRLK